MLFLNLVLGICVKILLTINDISITGGAERVVVNLANALAEAGNQVEILSFYKANENLPYDINAHIKLHFWHDIPESTFSTQMCRNICQKIYYKNFYKIALSISVYHAFKGFDIVIGNDTTYTPYLKHHNMRYIRLFHMRFDRYNTRNNFFHTLIVLSHKELPLWQSYHKDVRVIANFLPFIPTQCTDISQKRVVCVGRLSKEKGFLRLIDIWALVQQSLHKSKQQFSSNFPSSLLDSWQLIIVGEGELKSEIESKIKALHLEDSILLKPFTKEIEKEYLNASIYAMSSHFEGFPMVLLESCSYGLCPIAFDVKTGPSDIIEHKKSGYLIEDNDLQGYANALIELMSDENRREEMGKYAKQRVKESFSKEAIMPLWEEVFKHK